MEAVRMRDSTAEVVVVDNVSSEGVDSAPVLRLRLKKPKPERQVAWREGTVDNEDMGKKKSKCCCIYKKSVNFGESSSSDDEECEHCFGHPEKRRKNVKKRPVTAQEVELDISQENEMDETCTWAPKGRNENILCTEANVEPSSVGLMLFDDELLNQNIFKPLNDVALSVEEELEVKL